MTAYTDTPRFIDNGDGTVTEPKAGLTWSKSRIDEVEVSHEKAVQLCAELRLGGHDNWRLPKRAELESLCDATEFHSDSRWYWSSTFCGPDLYCAWVVTVPGGTSGYQHLSLPGFVLAVRTRDASDPEPAASESTNEAQPTAKTRKAGSRARP